MIAGAVRRSVSRENALAQLLQAADLCELRYRGQRRTITQIDHYTTARSVKAVNRSGDWAMDCHGCSAAVLKVGDRAGGGCLHATVMHGPKGM